MTSATSAFEQLARFHWVKDGVFETGWADLDLRRADVRSAMHKDNVSIRAVLGTAGYKENSDFYCPVGARFEDGMFLRLDIPRVALTNPILAHGVMAARTAWLKANKLNGRSISSAQRAALKTLHTQNWSRAPATGDVFIDVPPEGFTRPPTDHFMAVCASAEQTLQENGLLAGVHYMYRNITELRGRGEKGYTSTLAIPAQYRWLTRMFAAQ